MRSDNTFLKIILILSLLGILVSGWLLNTHIKFATGQASLTESCSLPGGGASEGCANIAVSEYSDVFGVPLAAIAMGFYFTILLLAFWAMRNYQAALEPLYVGFFLSTISIVVTVVMFSISRFVLQSFCLGCSLLWMINLALWPSFVKHLKLNWGNALGANLELVRRKELNLKNQRLTACFSVGAACMLVFSVIGTAAKGLQGAETAHENSSITADFKLAPQMFLPPEAAGGPTSKSGVPAGKNPVMEIVEFADFQCPGCRAAAQYLKPFVRKHGEKVRVTFRNYPLDGSCNGSVPNGGHRVACASARAAICAGQQGKFWEMHDLIFDNQENLSPQLLTELQTKAGLEPGQMTACLSDSKTETLLQQDIQWGDMTQLQSTPTLIINGRRLAGARSPKDLETLLGLLEKEAK